MQTSALTLPQRANCFSTDRPIPGWTTLHWVTHRAGWVQGKAKCPEQPAGSLTLRHLATGSQNAILTQDGYSPVSMQEAGISNFRAQNNHLTIFSPKSPLPLLMINLADLGCGEEMCL